MADFGILARVCRPLLQLTKGQPFLQSLNIRGLYFRKPSGVLERVLRQQMGNLIKDTLFNTARGAPSWGELRRGDDFCHWKGFLSVPAPSPYTSVAVAIRFSYLYPFRSPTIYFDSRVFHPNVNVHGILCVPFLAQEGWIPSGCLISLLWNVIAVLGTPFVHDDYDMYNEAMKLYIENPEEYHQRAEELYNETEPGKRTVGASNKKQK